MRWLRLTVSRSALVAHNSHGPYAATLYERSMRRALRGTRNALYSGISRTVTDCEIMLRQEQHMKVAVCRHSHLTRFTTSGIPEEGTSMKVANAHVSPRYVVALLAAIVAGCSADSTPITGVPAVTPTLGFSMQNAALRQIKTAPVSLGTAGNFVILAKTGVSTVPKSAVTGNIGVSPIARGGLTGWSETMDRSNTFSTSKQVVGKLFAADYSAPSPSNLRVAVLDMQAAYTNAAGRAPDYTELGAGNIGGMTLSPGTYKWSSGVKIPTNVTLKGTSTDVWIFQIAGTVTQASATRVILTGGALAKNVFWQAAGVVALGTTAHMEGIILGQTGITLATGATVNGRLLAQTAVTLQMSVVTQP
jgi:hypothetical protein